MSQPITAVTTKALRTFFDPSRLEFELLGDGEDAGEASVGGKLSLLGRRRLTCSEIANTLLATYII